jgi:hypothetical protein
MTAITEQQSDGKTKYLKMHNLVGQLNSENIKIRFSFDPTFTTLTAIDGIIVDPTKAQ